MSGRGAQVPHADRWIGLGFVLAAALEASLRAGNTAGLVIGLAGAPFFGCLALRTARPLATLTIFTVGGVTGSLLQARMGAADPGSAVAVIALLVATYSLGAHGSRRALLLGAPQPVLLILAVDLLQPGDEPVASALPFAVVFVVVAPVAAGRLVRARSRLVEQLQAQATELETHRDEVARARVARERLRLAEEVHGSLLAGMEQLADQVSRMTVDAGPQGIEDVTAVEEEARELLARTRTAVVSLASAPPAEKSPSALARPVAPSGSAPEAHPWTALAAAALASGLLVELPHDTLAVPAPVAVFAAVVLVLPLAFAWVAPLGATLALWSLAAGFDGLIAALDGSFSAIGLAFVPPFVVAALATRPRAVVGLLVCLAGELVTLGRGAVADAGVVIVLAWLAGLVLHERIRLVGELRHNAVLLAEQRTASADRAIFEERDRLARELHDALGHSLTVVALQAGAARRCWSSDPDRALAALGTIRAVTHDGLEDLRDGLGGTAAGPLAGGRSLVGLVERARAVGLPVTAEIEELADLLDPEAELVVYRVLQESLTNVLRHAPGAPTEVLVRAQPGWVEVTVCNAAGTAVVPAAAGSGRGLVGMLSRATACGGELEWGPEPRGGFRVRAHLPRALVAP